MPSGSPGSQTTGFAPAAELDFGLLPVHAPVAIRIQNHRLGGHQRAVAIDMKPAALEGQAGMIGGQAEPIEDADRGLRILLVIRQVPAPAIEAPVDSGQRSASWVAQEARSGIAHPRVVESYRYHFHAGAAKLPRAIGIDRVRHHDDRFETRDRVGDIGIVALDRGKVFPLRVFGRPGHPAGAMRRPFGWHQVSPVGRTRLGKIVRLIHGDRSRNNRFSIVEYFKP